MKGYLLDTHIFLWAFSKPGKIGKPMAKVIESPNSIKYLSAISLVEIAQLYEMKPREFDLKIPVSTYISQGLTELRVQVLPIATDHAQRYYEIQAVKGHKDPFDRIIIAQAAHTGFTVLSDDENFPKYPITVLSNR